MTEVKVGQKWQMGEYVNEIYHNLSGEIVEIITIGEFEGKKSIEAVFVNPKLKGLKWWDGNVESFAELNILVSDVK